jgi:hypothetical protein
METDTNQRHPNSAFQASYPYNQATITRSGHEIHLNDTPGSESIRIAHTKGTYFEVESTGRWVHTIAEKCYQYIKSTYTQTVDSHYDVKIGGTYTFNCDASAMEQVGENKTMGVGGDLIDGVGGVRELHTESDKIESVNGDLVLGIQGDRYEAVQGSQVTNITGIKSDILDSDWSVTSAGAVDMQVEGDFRMTCKNFTVNATENITMYAGGAVTITTGAGPITITAAGVVYVNGTQIRLND